MLKSKISLLVASTLLAACSSATYENASADNQEKQQQTSQLLEQSQKPTNTADTSRVPVRPGVYLGATSTKLQSGQMLPGAAEREGIRLIAPEPKTLIDIGDLVSEASGIPVSFAEDIFKRQEAAPEVKPASDFSAFKGGANGQSDANDANQLASVLEAVLPKSIDTPERNRSPSVFSGMLNDISRDTMRVNYRGSLSGFLNLAAAYFDIGWTYHDGRIQFSRQITRTFQLAAMPTQVSTSASMTGGVSSSGGDGASVTTGANQTSQVDMKLDFWKELEATLKNIIGEQGTFTTSPTSNSITVNGPASLVEKVGREVQEINRQLLRQVSMKVEVYRLKLKRNSNWNFDFNTNFASGIGKFNLGAGSTSMAAGGQFGGIEITGGKFEGSKAALQLLEQNGDVSVVTSASVTTMSGQPVPVQVSNTRGYIEKITQNVDNGTVTTSAETNTATAGFAMSLIPSVMDNGNILLQYNMNISSFVGANEGFRTKKVGADEMQLLDVEQRSFIQSGMIRNGSTLVVAGFEQTTSSTSDSGQGKASFKLFGGSRAGENDREMLIIMITPQVLDHTLETGHLN